MNYNSNKNKEKKEQKVKEKQISSIKLLDNRIIYVDGSIDDALAKDVIDKLLRLDTLNHDDIVMYINSNGGNVSSGLAIYDTMNMIKSKVSTVCIGKCFSMASVLLVNGAKGKRYILPNAEVMIHEVSSISVGKVGEMQNNLDHSRDLNHKLFKILAEKSNRTYNQIKNEATGKDLWLSASKALQYGIIDKILYSSGDYHVYKKHRQRYLWWGVWSNHKQSLW